MAALSDTTCRDENVVMITAYNDKNCIKINISYRT